MVEEEQEQLRVGGSPAGREVMRRDLSQLTRERPSLAERTTTRGVVGLVVTLHSALEKVQETSSSIGHGVVRLGVGLVVRLVEQQGQES